MPTSNHPQRFTAYKRFHPAPRRLCISLHSPYSGLVIIAKSRWDFGGQPYFAITLVQTLRDEILLQIPWLTFHSYRMYTWYRITNCFIVNNENTNTFQYINYRHLYMKFLIKKRFLYISMFIITIYQHSLTEFKEF